MNTDELIATLAADTRINRPRLALRTSMGALLSLALLVAFWHVRPDLGVALQDPLVMAKFALPLGVAVTGWMLRPGLDGARPFWLLMLPVLVAVGLFGVTMPTEDLPTAIMGSSWLVCLGSIPFLALPIGVGAFAALRRTVVTQPARAGMVAGLMAGAVAALIYALHCDEDAPSFYTVWYSLGIVLCAIAGRVAGRRLLGV